MCHLYEIVCISFRTHLMKDASYFSSYKWPYYKQKIILNNCSGFKFSKKKHDYNLLQSSESLSIHASFCICCVVYTFFYCFEHCLIQPFKPQNPHSNSPNRSLYISLKKKLRESDKRSKHFLFSDHFINSHNLIS